MSLALAPTTAPAGLLTPDDLLRMPDEGKGYELDGGKLEKLNVSALSSYVAGRTYLQLSIHGSGWVFPEGTSYCCFAEAPGRVRRPDTSYISRARYSLEMLNEQGQISIAPDLAVEVISPGDRSGKVNRKRIEWRKAGVKLIWIIHPQERTVHIYREDGTVSALAMGDTLTGEHILPGLSFPIATLFEPAAA